MQSERQIFDKVRTCFAEALEVDPKEIRRDARVFADLGAESVDLLDIVFRLERAFGIRIPRGGIETRARKKVRRWVSRGVLTDEALEVIRQSMPEVDPSEIKPGLRPKDLPRLFNVQTFVNLVVLHLEEKSPRTSLGSGGRASRVSA